MIINEINYEIIENYKDAIDKELLKDKITDYYNSFDYILGDWAYGKVRLKGFYDPANKKANKINNYSNIKKYIEKNCAYGCKYFILKRIEK